jgi:hypothetical protein
MTSTEQHEITAPGALLDAQGNLTAAGWSRQYLLDCNLENANFYKLRFLQPLRMKRWDYYAIFTPTHFFSFTVSDIGYLGMIFAYIVDFEKKHYHEETVGVPFASGVALPRNSTEGESLFDNGKVRLHFTAGEGERKVSANWPHFEGEGLSAEVSFAQPADHQSMNIIIPIEGRRFYYNRKVNCMPASGWVTYKGQHFALDPKTCLGSLDWGRGVWAYDSFWVWASASGFLPDGRTVGLNMGYGFGDTSAATENAFILDGVVHKYGQVDFSYDPKDFMKPWTMRSPDKRLDLTFEPFLERVATTDLRLLRSEVHQMFGRYSGVVHTDRGEVIELNGLVGFAEEHYARW